MIHKSAKNKNVNKVQKTPIKYQIQLNEEQKAVKEGVFKFSTTFIIGSWGTGKTLTAVQIALDLVFRKDTSFDKIILSRPIDFSATGFLKGSADEKMAFHIFPLKQNLYALYNKEKIDKMFLDGIIQVIPIDYMKGITATNAIMIIDEFEDIKYDDFKLIATRLGKGSKLIFTGDLAQAENKKESCINKILCLEHSGLVNFHKLTANHREPEIIEILKYIEENNK